MTLTYPRAFTDADWKAAEKRIKVSATGIGKTLRALEAAANTLNGSLGRKDYGKIDAQVHAVVTAAQASEKAITAEWQDVKKKGKNTAAEQYLNGFEQSMKTYRIEMQSFGQDVANKHGLDEMISDYVERFNHRVKLH